VHALPFCFNTLFTGATRITVCDLLRAAALHAYPYARGLLYTYIYIHIHIYTYIYYDVYTYISYSYTNMYTPGDKFCCQCKTSVDSNLARFEVLGARSDGTITNEGPPDPSERPVQSTGQNGRNPATERLVRSGALQIGRTEED